MPTLALFGGDSAGELVFHNSPLIPGILWRFEISGPGGLVPVGLRSVSENARRTALNLEEVYLRRSS